MRWIFRLIERVRHWFYMRRVHRLAMAELRAYLASRVDQRVVEILSGSGTFSGPLPPPSLPLDGDAPITDEWWQMRFVERQR